ncbi:hypothetical protein Y032_0348g3169 [Ancylostoma ceylanicum]|nr:hypothetical protein Y032_0348g3169 [Ancylostoma ceylanicum]
MTPDIHRNIFGSITFRRRSTSLLADQHSAPYKETDQTTARFAFDSKQSFIFLLHIIRHRVPFQSQSDDANDNFIC